MRNTLLWLTFVAVAAYAPSSASGAFDFTLTPAPGAHARWAFLPHAALDPINSKIIVVSANYGASAKAHALICDLDLGDSDSAACSFHDVSAGRGSSGALAQVVVDTVRSQMIVVSQDSGRDNRLYVVACALDGSGCVGHDVAASLPPQSGINPSVAIDAAASQLLIASRDGSSSHSAAFLSCDLASLSGCMFRNIGNETGQGPHSGYGPKIAVDPATGHRVVAVNDVSLGHRLGVYVCNATDCSYTDVAAATGQGSSSGAGPSMILDAAARQIVVATDSANKPSVYMCTLPDSGLLSLTGCTHHDVSGGAPSGTSLRPTLALPGNNSLVVIAEGKSDENRFIAFACARNATGCVYKTLGRSLGDLPQSGRLPFVLADPPRGLLTFLMDEGDYFKTRIIRTDAHADSPRQLPLGDVGVGDPPFAAATAAYDPLYDRIFVAMENGAHDNRLQAWMCAMPAGPCDTHDIARDAFMPADSGIAPAAAVDAAAGLVHVAATNANDDNRVALVSCHLTVAGPSQCLYRNVSAGLGSVSSSGTGVGVSLAIDPTAGDVIIATTAAVFVCPRTNTSSCTHRAVLASTEPSVVLDPTGRQLYVVARHPDVSTLGAFVCHLDSAAPCVYRTLSTQSQSGWDPSSIVLADSALCVASHTDQGHLLLHMCEPGAVSCSTHDVSALAGVAANTGFVPTLVSGDDGSLVVAVGDQRDPVKRLGIFECDRAVTVCTYTVSPVTAGIVGAPAMTVHPGGAAIVVGASSTFVPQVVFARTVPPPSPPPPPPPPPLVPPTQPVRDSLLGGSPATSSASVAMYVLIATIIAALLMASFVRQRVAAKYSTSPVHWLGLPLHSKVLHDHVLVGALLPPVPHQVQSRASRWAQLAFSSLLLLIVTATMPLINPEAYDGQAGLLTMERLYDVLLSLVLSTILSLFCFAPLINTGHASLDPVARRNTLLVAWFANVGVLLPLAVAIVCLPFAIDNVPAEPLSTLTAFATAQAIAWMSSDFLVPLFLFVVFRMCAVKVFQGGNGGVCDKQRVAPLSTSPLPSLPPSPSQSQSLSLSHSSSGLPPPSRSSSRSSSHSPSPSKHSFSSDGSLEQSLEQSLE